MWQSVPPGSKALLLDASQWGIQAVVRPCIRSVAAILAQLAGCLRSEECRIINGQAIEGSSSVAAGSGSWWLAFLSRPIPESKASYNRLGRELRREYVQSVFTVSN